MGYRVVGSCSYGVVGFRVSGFEVTGLRVWGYRVQGLGFCKGAFIGLGHFSGYSTG